MKIEITPGKYVVAVSGGVDSVSLLRILKDTPGVKLVVAHFDHGIRQDSREDRLFVESLARQYNLPFVYDEGRLGPNGSEAKAREARYNFLHKALEASGADAIVTAHHQDDLLETAIINLMRGTGRKGLSSLKSTDVIVRPLLDMSKKEIIDYAKHHHLTWREDPTNQGQAYLRNRIRHNVVPKLNGAQREQLLAIVARTHEINRELDEVLSDIVQPELDRQWFISLPHDLSKEVMAAWLRSHKLKDFDRKTLERLTVAAKVAHEGKQIEIVKNTKMQIQKDTLALVGHER